MYKNIIFSLHNYLKFFLSSLFPDPKNKSDVSLQSLLNEISIHATPIIPFSYKIPVVRKVIRLTKYYGHSISAQAVAPFLAEEVFEQASTALLWKGFFKIVVIPLPNSSERRKERGWNQTELIAQFVSETISLDKIEVRTDILYKVRRTVSQTTLSKRERLQNSKDSFQIIDGSLVKDEPVILFDDVITTGSTLGEAQNVLYKAGAKEVICLTIAFQPSL